MIGIFKDQDGVIERIAELLAGDERTGGGINLVLPPGFGEQRVPDAITAKLRDDPRVLVAAVSVDAVHDADDFCRTFHREWSLVCRALPPFVPGEEPKVFLGRLLRAVPSDRRPVLVLKKFHRVLTFLDASFLATLRDAEAGTVNLALRTLTTSIYSHQYIRRAWLREGKVLRASEYGLEHKRWTVGLDDLDAVVVRHGERYPPDLLRTVWAWTGGHPEPFGRTVADWESVFGRGELTPEVLGRLRANALGYMEPMVDHLDYQEDKHKRFRALCATIHQRGPGYTDAAGRLAELHPWHDLILDVDRLRASLVGELAVQKEQEEAFYNDAEPASALHTLNLAYQSYAVSQYDKAWELADLVRPPSGRSSVLAAHARLMHALRPDEGDFGPNTDWATVSAAVEAASRCAQVHVQPRLVGKLDQQYSRVRELADVMRRVADGDTSEVVDVLGGLKGNGPRSREYALLIVRLRIDSAAGLRSSEVVIQRLLPVPEQLLRLWAFWRYGVRYDKCPADLPVWAEAARIWSASPGQTPLIVPPAGKSFGNVAVFAHFLYAKAMLCGGDPAITPLSSLEDLAAAVQLFKRRNPPAHSVGVRTTDATRESFVATSERWFDCARIAGGDVSVNDLLRAVRPLPVLDTDGRLSLPSDTPNGEPAG